jgi:hypothetical protein
MRCLKKSSIDGKHYLKIGFLVGVGVVFGVVIGPVLGACIPVISKLILGWAATEPPKLHIHHLGSAWHNSFVGKSSCCRVIHLNRTFRLGPTLEDIAEVGDVIETHIFYTKVVGNEAKLDWYPFVAPETGC